ncbi:MAG: DUF460 domain-containing protein [Candidatus Micrarchaeaceae archaeon]
MIVGIDPGKTIAIACLSLDGHMLGCTHKKFADEGWVVSTIEKLGTPSIIATDKKRVGEEVRKINAIFNSRLFTPDKDLTVEEKRLLAKNARPYNQHELDAYAAAMKAYNYYSSKLKQAEHKTRAAGAGSTDAIKAKVIAKYSISEALENRKSNRR